MDPMTLSLIMMGVGKGMELFGGMQSSQATQGALSYNAEVANIRATNAIADATFQADIERRNQERVHGKIESAVAKSGTMMTGSALDILADQALTDELNLMSIKYSGDTAAYNLRSQAALSEAQADQQGQAGMIKSLATIASGAGQFGLMNRKMNLAKGGGLNNNDYNWLSTGSEMGIE